MPQRKRASAAAVPVAKAPKRDDKLDEVVDALEKLEGLPEEVRQMLVVISRFALSTPFDERTAVEASSITLIGDAFQKEVARLEEELAVEQKKISGVEAEAEAKKKTIESSEVLLTEKKANVAGKRQDISEKTLPTREACLRDLTKAEATQTEADASLVTMEAEKVKLEEMVSGGFAVLKNGTWEDVCDAKSHAELLVPMVKGIGLDDSLAAALPSASVKKPGERGGFDNIIMSETEKFFAKRIETIETELASAAPAKIERAAAVDAAKAAHEIAKKQFQDKAVELAAAVEEESEAAAAVTQALDASKKFEPELRSSTKARNAAKLKLDIFTDITVDAYETLRTRVSKKAVEEVCVPKIVEETVPEDGFLQAGA